MEIVIILICGKSKEETKVCDEKSERFRNNIIDVSRLLICDHLDVREVTHPVI